MVGEDTAENLAQAFLRFRRARSDVLPREMLGEPAWDLLLELFVADSRGRRITGREVLAGSCVSPNVLSRWLMFLTSEGLIVGDGAGNLDDALTLSADGIGRMEQVLEHARELKNLVGHDD
jgi:hypothetical protein